MDRYKMVRDTFCAIYPAMIVQVLYIGALSFVPALSYVPEINIAALAELAGGIAILVGVSAMLLSFPVFTYYLIAEKSKRVAVIIYYALLVIMSWWISPGLKAELGYDGFAVAFMIVLLGYGGAVGWTLSRPTFLRTLPAAGLTLILLVVYLH